jgi:7-carboxy-7-deazaguanine synthase
MDAASLAVWLRGEVSAPIPQPPFVVCTGGEPLLQLDEDLISALKVRGSEVAVETNGAKPAPPPAGLGLRQSQGGRRARDSPRKRAKLVYPQAAAPPEHFDDLVFDYFFLQPMDGSDLLESSRRCIDYCRSHPKWRLSLQMHKILGIP